MDRQPNSPISDVHYQLAHGFEGEPEHVRLIQQRFAAYFAGRDRVLDIGCGQGVFLEVLRQAGCHAEGVDLDPQMAALAGAKGFTVHCTDILSFLEQCENQFDGIYAAHIIEHFHGADATRIVQQCARILKPNGVLVVVTPNFRHPLVREEVFWLDVTHVRPYPPKLLAKMMESVGLNVADVGACPEGLNDVFLAAVKRANPEQDTVSRGPSARKAPAYPPILWEAPLLDASGYADEARQFVLGLDALGLAVQAKSIAWNNRRCDLDEHTRQRLQKLLAAPANETSVHVQHVFPPGFKRTRGMRRAIGRTMFETDRLPADWVAACNAMDEIWVPTRFNVETFARSGVDKGKLFVVHSPLNSRTYDVNLAALPVPDRRGFNFLSVFDWQLRKGWDVLIRAYVEEFAPGEDVALMLKVSSSAGLSLADIRKQIQTFVENQLHRDFRLIPHMVFIGDTLSTAQMPRLFKAADAYVMPSHCEGWGRPFMEAMATGLPTIGTRWSGNTEFMNDANSFLVEPAEIVPVPETALQEVPNYRGHKWAEQGRLYEAEVQWRTAVHSFRDFAPAWLGLAGLYLEQARWQEMEELAIQMETAGRLPMEAAVVRARLWLVQREFTAARRQLEQTVVRFPTAIPPRRILSYALLQEGRDWPAAERALRDLLALAPEDAEARNNLNVLLDQQGEMAESSAKQSIRS